MNLLGRFASLCLIAAVLCLVLPPRHGLRCRFGLALADGHSEPPPAKFRRGLLRVQYSGITFARPSGCGVDPDIRSWWPAGALKDGSFRWTGWIYVPKSGIWSIGTCSDDGSAVLIDDRLVATNWGGHSARSHFGRAQLEEGWHHLRVDYFNVDGYGSVELMWKAPGGPIATVPQGFLATEREPGNFLEAVWGALSGDADGRPRAIAPSPLKSGELAAVPLQPVRWHWADMWAGAGPESVVAGGTGEPAPCAGLDAPGMLPGGWRVWHTRVRLGWTARMRLRFPHAAPVVVWVGGAPVLGTPAQPDVGPRSIERVFPGGLTDLVVATSPCAPSPPLALEPVLGAGEQAPPFAYEPPARLPWPAAPQAASPADGVAAWGAARVRYPVEPLCEEVHERVWFSADTRLQAPYIYRWDTNHQGHPSQLPPLVATWDGEVDVPRAGTWTFHVRSSGRAWLTVGGRTLYKDAGIAESALRVELAGGRHAIKLDAFDPGVVRTIALSWTPPGDGPALGPAELVPASALYPAGDRGPWDAIAGWASGVALLIVLIGGAPTYARFVWRHRAWHAWVLLIVVGLCLRLHEYDTIPAAGDTDDELTYHMVGTSLLKGFTPIGWAWMNPFPLAVNVPLNSRVFRIVAPMVAYPPLYSLIIGGVNIAAGATSAFEARLHVTRLVPIGLSTLTVAMLAPLARAMGMRRGAGLLATACLAIYPQAVVQSRLIKEENLLAPLFLCTLWLVLGYRKTSGPGRRLALGATIIAAILTKPMGIAGAAMAFAGLSWRRHWRAAGYVALAAVLGVLSFVWYGFAYGGEAYVWQMRMFAGYAERMDVLTPLSLHNTVTGYAAPAGWLVGMWIVGASTLLSLKVRRRRFLGLLVASYALVTAATYPSQLNWGWYKIPLWPMFALAWGQQAWRLMRRAEPLSALLFVGLFLFPTIEALGGPVAGWPEATQVSAFLGFLKGGTPTGWVSPSLVVRLFLIALVCPTFLVNAVPRPARRVVAFAVGGAILLAIFASMALLAWHWGLVYPTAMAGDPWLFYENTP